MRHLGLPAETILAEDLDGDGELFGTFQQGGTDDDLVTCDGLVVVNVGGAVGAVIAVYGLACGMISMIPRIRKVVDVGVRRRETHQSRQCRYTSWWILW